MSNWQKLVNVEWRIGPKDEVVVKQDGMETLVALPLISEDGFVMGWATETHGSIPAYADDLVIVLPKELANV